MAMNQMNTLEHAPLTAQDRCDRCGAQAYVRAVLTNGTSLHTEVIPRRLKCCEFRVENLEEI